MTDAEALAKFRAGAETILGDRIERMVLFGSRARGTHRPDSDYDVAIFLHGFCREKYDAWYYDRRPAKKSRTQKAAFAWLAREMTMSEWRKLSEKLFELQYQMAVEDGVGIDFSLYGAGTWETDGNGMRDIRRDGRDLETICPPTSISRNLLELKS